jgi:multiple sugar transport system substrate-binding protein
MQQMLTFCAGGKCPDVLMAWELTYAALADRGVLLDLNTLLAGEPTCAAELRSDSVPMLYDTFGFNGGQYAFPEQWSGNFLFFNKKLFDEAHLRPLAVGKERGVSPSSLTAPWRLPSATRPER